MIVGIDASNIRVGGGVTHLVEMLRAADPCRYGITKVIVWSSSRTLDRISDRPDWLVKKPVVELEKGFWRRMHWQSSHLGKCVREAKCDLLLVPGGNYGGDFKPFVAMSQNLLPFEWKELKRYGFSVMTLKMVLLRYLQSRTFSRADGVIFLTQYAKNSVMKVIRGSLVSSKIIPLGISESFFSDVDQSKLLQEYSIDRPCNLLYVSVVDVYKHQWHVAEAVAALRREGYPVVLDLVGPAVGDAIDRLRKIMSEVDPSGDFIRYRGQVAHDKLAEFYQNCDVNIFASSCENMPNILLEAMASGIPVACSNLGPMSEVLGDAGEYFNPESPIEISAAIRKLFESPSLRLSNARKAYQLARNYSWSRCADESFSYFEEILACHGCARDKV